MPRASGSSGPSHQSVMGTSRLVVQMSPLGSVVSKNRVNCDKLKPGKGKKLRLNVEVPAAMLRGVWAGRPDPGEAVTVTATGAPIELATVMDNL